MHDRECPVMEASACLLYCYFIVLVLFYVSASLFLTSRSLWFTWWLVYVGTIWVTFTPSDIKNSLTPDLKLLKNVAKMSNGDPTSCGSASILRMKRV